MYGRKVVENSTLYKIDSKQFCLKKIFKRVTSLKVSFKHSSASELQSVVSKERSSVIWLVTAKVLISKVVEIYALQNCF